MKSYTGLGMVVVSLLALGNLSRAGGTPFSGTIFIDPDIITATDPTTFRHDLRRPGLR